MIARGLCSVLASDYYYPAPLLAAFSDLPHGDWRIGAPFYLCAAIQAVAAWLGLRYLGRHVSRQAAAAA